MICKPGIVALAISKLPAMAGISASQASLHAIPFLVLRIVHRVVLLLCLEPRARGTQYLSALNVKLMCSVCFLGQLKTHIAACSRRRA